MANESKEMNCFLNSALQALFRMLRKGFTKNLFACGSLPSSHSCIACNLLKIFDNYTEEIAGHQRQIFTVELRHQLAMLYTDDKFAMNQKADSMEVLSALFVGIHNSFNRIYNSIHMHLVIDCQCPVHLILTLNFTDIHSCTCGFEKIITSSNFFQTFIPYKLDGNLAELAQKASTDIPYCLKHIERFCEYISEQIVEGLETSCECGKKYLVKRLLNNPPEYFVIQIVWEEVTVNKLKSLELFISLKFRINIREIYKDATSEMYNIAGFIVNMPGHYVYIGRTWNGWVIVSDEKIMKIQNWSELLIFMFQNEFKTVGIIYQKSCIEVLTEISIETLNTTESYLTSKSKCSNCSETLTGKKCESCGWSLSQFENLWKCKNCESENIKGTITCKFCQFNRFRPKTLKCYRCETSCKTYSCKKHTPNTCFSCSQSIYFYQERFCRFCSRSTGLKRECDYCSKEFEFGEMICYKCTAKYWTCPKCSKIQNGTQDCSQCGLGKNEPVWYCPPCKSINLLNSPCGSCRSPFTPNLFCLTCGQNSQNQCTCLYSFTCAVCKSEKSYPNRQICWKDGGFLKNGVCETCTNMVPREFIVCSFCYPTTVENREIFAENFVNNIKNSCKEEKQCVNCGKFTNEKIRFCWICRYRKEFGKCNQCGSTETLCLECLKHNFSCDSCECTVFDSTCPNCTRINIDKVSYFKNTIMQRFDDDWNCFACNSFNRNYLEFCEQCNHSKGYSFTNLYFCQFCHGKSHDFYCKKCFWTSHCSSCEKKNFTSQNTYCGNCRGVLYNQYCSNCKEYVSRFKILCRSCSFLIANCGCGNKMHPKALTCKYCRLKTKYTIGGCAFCKATCEYSICCYCDAEFENGSSKNCGFCRHYFSSELYYCRNCCYKTRKCRKCTNFCFGYCNRELSSKSDTEDYN